MASQSVTGTQSRLSQMQMRFQQKQLQEREKKKLDLTATLNSETVKSVSTTKATTNGKVRQMFDERRRGAGIDRSNPLKPISKPISSRSLLETSNEVPQNGNTRTMQRRTLTVASIKNTNNNDRSSLSKSFSKLNLNEAKTASPVSGGGDRNNNIANTKRTVAAPATNIKLKPVVVKKTQASTSAVTPATPPRAVITPPKSQSSKNSTPLNSARRPTPANNTKPVAKPSKGKITLSVKPPPRVVTPPPGMVTCQFCSRNFLEERLPKHAEICKKMLHKQRKIFDATKQRVQGTEVEQYVKKQLKSGASLAAKTATASKTSKSSNWRIKHEEFLKAVRNARMVQAHLAKGGNLADIPPPPPSVNPDYVQCPHCKRRFNQSAAERHIPKCADMQHNKPKPGQKKR